MNHERRKFFKLVPFAAASMVLTKIGGTVLADQSEQSMDIENEKSAIREIIFGYVPSDMSLIKHRMKTFKDPRNRIVMRAIHQLFIRREPVNVAKLSNRLIKNGMFERIGGWYYIGSFLV